MSPSNDEKWSNLENILIATKNSAIFPLIFNCFLLIIHFSSLYYLLCNSLVSQYSYYFNLDAHTQN